MGINTIIKLPNNVRINDVATIIGVAVGLPTIKREFSINDGFYTKVSGIKFVVHPTSPQMVNITFGNRHLSYFFETEENMRSLYCGSSPLWTAVGFRLVDFFGGYLDINDCDDIDVDYLVPDRGNDMNAPTDGEAYFDFQRRMYDVPRISKSELNKLGSCIYDYDVDDNGFIVYT
jgi:hypothetical protein